jgi:putative flippase GtrA
MRRGRNWLQLLRFCTVGGIGYAVNVSVFAICAEGLGLHHLAAATVAFAVAVSNNFLWNRQWTFDARSGHARSQAMRFLTVSVAAFLLAATVLQLLIAVGGVAAVPAQAISIAIATPLNFLGNKIWTFGDGAPVSRAAAAAADAGGG